MDKSKNEIIPIKKNSPSALISYYEQSYSSAETNNNSSNLKLNSRNQILENINGTSDTLNAFDENGRILMSQTKTFKFRIHSADSKSDFEKPYIHRDTAYSITLFDYNQSGSLTTFAYFNRKGENGDNSFGLIYKRDSNDHIIQEKRYDSHAILQGCFGDFKASSDDYLKNIITRIKDSSYTVNDIFSKCTVINENQHFWNSTYKYDTLGNCVEYIHYGHRSLYSGNQQTLRATWEYTNGVMTKEIQYDSKDKLKATLEYDEKENVIKETIILGDNELVFDYRIEYY